MWSIIYIDGYYIHVEGNLVNSFPIEQSIIITIDSTVPGEVNISVDNNLFEEGLSVVYKGELPNGIRTYTENNMFVIEGPLPQNSEINMAWTPKYQFSRGVNLATNNVFGIFGINGKNIMETLSENMWHISAALFCVEFIADRYNRKHNQITVINYYKINILYIKQEILVLVKHKEI